MSSFGDHDATKVLAIITFLHCKTSSQNLRIVLKIFIPIAFIAFYCKIRLALTCRILADPVTYYTPYLPLIYMALGEPSIITFLLTMHSNPLLAFDWIYFATAAGHKFLHNCNLVHKFSEEVILQRRDELLKVILLS